MFTFSHRADTVVSLLRVLFPQAEIVIMRSADLDWVPDLVQRYSQLLSTLGRYVKRVEVRPRTRELQLYTGILGSLTIPCYVTLSESSYPETEIVYMTQTGKLHIPILTYDALSVREHQDIVKRLIKDITKHNANLRVLENWRTLLSLLEKLPLGSTVLYRTYMLYTMPAIEEQVNKITEKPSIGATTIIVPRDIYESTELLDLLNDFEYILEQIYRRLGWTSIATVSTHSYLTKFNAVAFFPEKKIALELTRTIVSPEEDTFDNLNIIYSSEPGIAEPKEQLTQSAKIGFKTYPLTVYSTLDNTCIKTIKEVLKVLSVV